MAIGLLRPSLLRLVGVSQCQTQQDQFWSTYQMGVLQGSRLSASSRQCHSGWLSQCGQMASRAMSLPTSEPQASSVPTRTGTLSWDSGD